MRLIALSVLLACTSVAKADVALPAIFSDNMVLQAGKPVQIWGKADAGEKVSVKIANRSAESTAGPDGTWRATLEKLEPGDAKTMTIVGKNSIEIKNILVGSVWLCSGQSNMQWVLNAANNGKEEAAKADYPSIRVFTVANVTSIKPEWDVPMASSNGKPYKSQWIVCTPKSAPNFSAVAYFFGRDVHLATGQAVGLINSSWGGTPAQAWTSIEGLKKDKSLDVYYSLYDTTVNNIPTARAEYEKALAAYQVEKKKWDEEVGAPFEEEMKEYAEALKKAKAERTPEPGKPLPSRPAPKPPAEPATSIGPGIASSLFNSMIHPLIPLAIEGVIWYQGESNADKADLYATLFPRMINDWRERWGQGDFPFYFVSLAAWLPRHETPTDEAWAHLRESQRLTLKLPNTGMALAIDIGDMYDIHPRNKLDVGRRLALLALRDVYGKKIVASGPLYAGMKIEGDKIRLKFKEVGSGLVAGKVALTTTQPAEGELVGFAIAGEDGKFVWAKAVIDGETIVVSNPAVAKPVKVRYAWANNPACNLYNKDGLPASPFQTYGEE